MTSPSKPSAEAIQRVLFIASVVHVYSIPPLTSSKGYNASSWTEDGGKRQIFTARMRVIETALPLADGSGESLSTEVRLEDPSTGLLFAAAPYTDSKAVEAALDSSRFFAVRVVSEDGMKATLGIGFEERGEAVDFGICLQDVRKILGLDPVQQNVAGKGAEATAAKQSEQKDWSLKEGQTIRVDIGKRGSRRHCNETDELINNGGAGDFASEEKPWFSTQPSSGQDNRDGGTSLPILTAPPASGSEARAEKRRSRGLDPRADVKDMGFDDGEFGEFQ